MDSLDSMKQQQAYIDRQVRGWARVGELHAEMMKEIEALTAEQRPPSIDVDLTPKQMEIFELMGKGLKNKAIAEKRGGSRKTVESTQQNIKKALKIKNMYAVREFATSYMKQKSKNFDADAI